MSDDRVSVSILDKDYQVACTAEERHDLMPAAAELDRRMRDVRKSGTIVGLERIAIMVALNLCHELQQRPQEGVELPETLATLERLSNKLSGALANHQ
jgi:cell division protein ZapA